MHDQRLLSIAIAIAIRLEEVCYSIRSKYACKHMSRSEQISTLCSTLQKFIYFSQIVEYPSSLVTADKVLCSFLQPCYNIYVKVTAYHTTKS